MPKRPSFVFFAILFGTKYATEMDRVCTFGFVSLFDDCTLLI